MGEVIEKIVIKVLPDLEVTVKGTDNDMFEIGAKIVSALRERGLHPDIQMIYNEEIRNILKEIH